MTRGYVLLIALFAASGCSGLILEILWQRQMMLVLGASAPAITAILTSFFFGIALGSAIGGRLLARFKSPRSSLRFYAATEAWIGCWALAVPLLLHGSDLISQHLLADLNAEGAAALTVRFVLAVLVVLPATTGMGATIPVMSRLLHTAATGAGRAVSIAYGVNAGGAVVGCVLAGFVLMQSFGIRGALFCAIGLNLCVAMVALLMAQRANSEADQSGAATGRWHIALRGPRGLVLAVYVGSSFCALGLELVWFRILAIFNSNGLVTFTTGLATYILGYSIGSLLLYPFVRRRVGSLGVLAISCLGAGLAAGLMMTYAQLCQHWIGIGVEQLIGAIGVSFAAATTREVLNAAVLMFVPTLFMGMAFPAVCDAVSDAATDIADSSGQIYFLGNIGGAFGAMLTGLVFIPGIGIRATGFGLAVLLMLFRNFAPSEADTEALGARRAWLRARTPEIVAVAVFAAYVLSPISYKWIWPISHRMVPVVALFALGTLAWRRLPWRPALLVVPATLLNLWACNVHVDHVTHEHPDPLFSAQHLSEWG